MKIAHLLLAVMFLLFAFLQVNDPDPVLWILIYGVMAVLSVLAAFKIYPRVVYVVLMVAYIGYGVALWPGVREWLAQDELSVVFDDVMKMEYPYIEESREFLGLLIAIVVLAWYLILSRKR